MQRQCLEGDRDLARAQTQGRRPRTEPGQVPRQPDGGDAQLSGREHAQGGHWSRQLASLRSRPRTQLHPREHAKDHAAHDPWPRAIGCSLGSLDVVRQVDDLPNPRIGKKDDADQPEEVVDDPGRGDPPSSRVHYAIEMGLKQRRTA